jgi:hypothetical protein
VVADLLVRRPRAAVDGDVAAGPGGSGGQEEGPDVVPGSPPALDHLEPPGPRRLLGHRHLAVAVPRLRRRVLRVLQQPPHELQPRRQVEREQVALVEELVRRRRERRLLPAALELELEAGRGGRRKRRGRRGEVHVDVVVLDHHRGRPRRRCRCHAKFASFGWLEGEKEGKDGREDWNLDEQHRTRSKRNGWEQDDDDGL